MSRYVARRLLGAIPLVVGIATVAFFVVHLAPGEPALYLLSPGMTQEVVEEMRAHYGLSDPVPVRYVKWIGAALTGDFGHSYTHGRPVRDVLLGFLPNTLLLSGGALALAFALGIALGVLQAVRQYSAFDSAASAVTLFFYSMPSFWLALMMILVFSLFARNVWEWPLWFPASGMYGVDYDVLSPVGKLLERARYLVLPTVSLALVLTAGIARYTRASMLEVIRQDYVRSARAKGLPEHVVVLRHALRNALLPVITLLGLHLPLLFSGAVFIEQIFAWPGLGKAMVDAIFARDYPLVVAGSFCFAAMVVIGNLVADLLYAVADPRIRYE